MKSTTLFSESGYYHICRFRTRSIRIDFEGKSLVHREYTRKVKLYFLGRYEQLYKYQLLTVQYQFAGHKTPLLTKKIAYLFDEIVLLSDRHGNIRDVANMERIKKRWQRTKEQLSKDHEGKVFENYVRFLDRFTQCKEAIVRFLSEAKMFGLLFNGFWNGAQNQKKIFGEMRLDIWQKEKRSIEQLVRQINMSNSRGELAGTIWFDAMHLREGYLKNNNTQFEILWLGKKKITQ